MPKNLGLYNDSLSVPRKKDIDELANTVDEIGNSLEGYVLKTGDSMSGTLTVGSKDTGEITLDPEGGVIHTEKLYVATRPSTTPNLFATFLSTGQVGGRVPSQVKSDIGLGNVDNVQQYSVSNPPPYPVTSVNGQTGDVTVTADIPDNLVKYTAVSDIQSVDGLNADTLEGHNAAYFATASGLSATNTQVATNTNNISTLTSGLSTANGNITTLQNDKVDKSGGTMTGALVAQNNTDYATAQVRNVIISTADPSGGDNGMLWIKYTN